jgi:hypothetical protein
MSDVRPNCYTCVHRGTIPGDAHSRCLHPALGPQPDNPFTAMVQLLGGDLAATTRVARQLNVTGHPTGIARGWFLWPANFDPTWLTTCDGYTPKEAACERT